MANLTRKNQKIFAQNATNNGQFGSLQDGSGITSNDLDILQNNSAYEEGWNDATISGEELPALEELQGLNYVNTSQIAYIMQKGIPEWEVATDYYIGDITREVGGTKLYKSLTDNNIGNTLTDVANWQLLVDLANLNQATELNIGLSLLPKQITTSNGADADHDMDFTAGNFQFDDGTGQATVTALTKQIDAVWVAGDNQGGLDTGVVAVDTTYHMFAIYNPNTLVSDFIFSASLSPTLPSGFTKKRRIASLVTDGAANIRNGTYAFFDDGSYKFIYNIHLDQGGYSLNVPTTRQPIDVTVPTSITVECLFLCNIQGFTTFFGSKYFLISSLDKPDNAATFSNSSIQLNSQGGNENENFSSPVSEVYSTTGGQIGVRGNVSDFSIQIYLKGWIDNNL